MSNHCHLPQGLEGDSNGRLGGVIAGDEYNGAAAHAFCILDAAEEPVGVLASGVVGETGSLMGNGEGWGAASCTGPTSGAGGTGDSPPGGMLCGVKCGWWGLR